MANSLPSDTVQFLSQDEVVAIHERLIQKFWGASGIRDPGMLQSALFRPQTGYYEKLDEMATALFESLLLNHPFVDGNKRIAFFGTDVFLRLNGWKMQTSADDAFVFLMARFDSGTCDFEHLLPWIRSIMIRI